MPESDSLSVLADRGCFVCGPDNPSGLQIQLDINPETCEATSQVTLDQRFQGWQGVIHGGILAALLDEVAIYACRSKGEQFVTAEINVRYRKPVPVGSIIDLKGRVTESRRNLYMVKSRIEINGTLYAEADVRVMQLDK